MKKLSFLFVLSIILISCKSNIDKNKMFVGEWEYSNSNKKDSLQNMSFSIVLSSKNDSIIGHYCSVTRGGNRVDCFDEKTQNVRGKISKDTLYVKFFSSFDGAKGNARLFFKNKKLMWIVGDFEGESLATNIQLEQKE